MHASLRKFHGVSIMRYAFVPAAERVACVWVALLLPFFVPVLRVFLSPSCSIFFQFHMSFQHRNYIYTALKNQMPDDLCFCFDDFFMSIHKHRHTSETVCFDLLGSTRVTRCRGTNRTCGRKGKWNIQLLQWTLRYNAYSTIHIAQHMLYQCTMHMVQHIQYKYI